jgi:hypothetical protein
MQKESGTNRRKSQGNADSVRNDSVERNLPINNDLNFINEVSLNAGTGPSNPTVKTFATGLPPQARVKVRVPEMKSSNEASSPGT